ncbi:hypothetical protein BOTBODRAFT_31572 [Botryobasidium botryosum FD-172 SS1]|uniref:Uncharacterized protein n=1 Tax=Botryobasidium botryosum (strain FD-172 SS1) TaxID=930990 RepID=A0A067MIT1_BOTB1|nr:hypothetical protein BOTBODRAFT_31572 [Botryobasidium botryosum FD-172 SS1]
MSLKGVELIASSSREIQQLMTLPSKRIASSAATPLACAIFVGIKLEAIDLPSRASLDPPAVVPCSSAQNKFSPLP